MKPTDPAPTRIEYQHFYAKISTTTRTGQTVVQGLPVVTVCYLRMAANDVFLQPWTAIGMAICSPSDTPWKKRGRELAYKRAMRAMRLQDFDLFINRDEAHHVLADSDFDRTHFADAKVALGGEGFRYGRKPPHARRPASPWKDTPTDDQGWGPADTEEKW